MAEMEGLYFGMGIDTSQLHSDFIDAEKTINQNLARINKEMQLIRIKGQVELEGLEESASSAEKLRVQEEALTAQINLQQDKIILLGATYEHLRETKGEYSETTKQVEYQLAREQLAAQKLQNQLADLSEQEKIAIGFNYEMLALIEPMWKGLEAAVAAGRTLPIPILHAKAAAAGVVGLAAFAAGTTEATNEFRENNPATILDESFRQASVSIDDSVRLIDDSWQRVVASTQQGTAQIHSSIKNASSDFELFGMKIFPDFNEVDFIRFVKILEDYRPSEAIVNTIELISQSDSFIGKLASTFIGTGYTLATIGQPLIEYAQTSMDSFRELTKAANELNLSLDKTSDLTTKIELAGGEYNDVRDYVRGVQDAVIKGDSEDPEVLALEKYGVVIQDTNGKLLAFDETLDRLYQGYLKAREAGEAEAYVMMTNGQSVHDVLPYFENLAKAQEDMSKIQWATLDYATLGELSNQMKLVDAQTGELKKSLSSLAAPAANIFLKDTLDTLKALTEMVEENREEIIYWSFVFVEGIKSLQDFAKELGSEAKENISEFLETLKELKDVDITSKLKSFFIPDLLVRITELGNLLKELEKEFEIISQVKSILPDELVNFFETAKRNVVDFSDSLEEFGEKIAEIDILKLLKNNFNSLIPDEWLNGLEMAKNYVVELSESLKDYEKEIERIRQVTDFFLPSISKLGIGFGKLLFEITNKEKSFSQDSLFGNLGSSILDPLFNRAQERLEEFKKANEEARQEIEKNENDLAGLSYSLNRIAKYKSELENLKFDMRYGEGFSYEKSLAQNKLWYDEAMKDAKRYADEQAIIEELYAAKSEQIEKERADKLAEIRESISSADKTALQQKLDSIEKEKMAWLQAGMEEAEAEQLAQQQKSNYIKGINQQLSAELNSLGQTDLQRKLSQIEQEKQAWIDKGADEEKAERLAQQKIRQAHEETESKLNEIRQSVAALDDSELENRLAAIEREKQAWIQAGMEKAEAEELAQQKISKTVESYEEQRAQAAEQYAEQVANAQKQYIEQVQAAREEADRKNRQEINDALNAVKSEAKELEAFIKDGYRGLQEYRYNQLLKSGVNPEYLKKMTPELMDEYRAAQEKADRSFLPSWRDRNSPREVEPPKIVIPDILAEVPPSFDKVSTAAANAAESLDNLARSAGYKPTDGINDLRAYEQPDGSTFITNNPQDLEDSIKNTASALNELPTSIKDTAEKFSNIEPPQIPEIESKEMPEIDTSAIAESVQSLSEMPEAVQAANESLNELPQAVLGIMEQISAIEPEQMPGNNLSEIEQNLSQLPTVIQTVTESLSELPTAISGLKENLVTEVSQLFSPMGETLSEVTVRINDFATSLGDFLQRLTSGGTTEQRTPVEVTNNISIEEAHAWDYDHIQELAERVADVLRPEILSAVGGDDNSY